MVEILDILCIPYLIFLFFWALDVFHIEKPLTIILPPPYYSKKVFSTRTEYYNAQGQLHRTNGPAREYNNGLRVYIINGHKISKEEFHKLYNKEI